MGLDNSLFLQGLVFSTAAILFFFGLAWFFFFSPLPKDKPVEVGRPPARLTNLLVGILGISLLMMIVGGLWDASMHIMTGEVPGGSDFLWPPHLVLYGGFLLAFIAAVIAILSVAASGWRSGVHDPRRWVRANPALGTVAMAATYALFSVPGDAIWHELFGIDLTAWSPPHVLIAVMMAIVSLSAVALWLKKPGVEARPFLRDLVTMTLLALGLHVLYIIGVLEWELVGERTLWVQARPIWLYPLVGGILALIFLLLAKYLTRYRWAATGTALIFYLVRIVVSYGLSATGNLAPLFPVVFLLGAFLLDVLPWERISSPAARVIAQAAAFTAGYIPVSMSILARREDLPAFSSGDYLAAVVLLFVLGVLFVLALDRAGKRLQRDAAPTGQPDYSRS